MAASNKVLFIGSKELGLSVLQKLYALSPRSIIGVITLNDLADPRSKLAEFRQFSSQHDIPIHIAASKKESEVLISQLDPNICFVVCWYWIVSEQLISTVHRGFLGVHNSLLPKYRGGSPLVWQLINGEKTIGCSLFSFTPGIDDGPIWAQQCVHLSDNDYISDAINKLEKSILKMLDSAYLGILNHTLTPKEQQQNNSSYFPMRTPKDGLINWNRSATEIFNFIKAQSTPYPGAFTQIGGNTIRIWRAEISKIKNTKTPGTFFKDSNGYNYVACGNEASLLLIKTSTDQ